MGYRSIMMLLTLLPLWLSAQKGADREAILGRARTHAKVLAAPDMAGRGYQDEGHLKAARYIAAEFEKYGLKPVPGLDESESPWFQPFRMGLSQLLDMRLVVNKKCTLRVGHDYIVKPSSARGEVTDLKVVDLGYGLPEDFDKSFEDKVVLFRSGLPERITRDKALKAEYKKFAGDDVKIGYAIKLKAAGVIILKEKLTAGLSAMPLEMLVMEVREESLQAKKIKKIKKASLYVDSKFGGIQTQNVMGMVEGRTHKDSVIIVCGHYDHLGRQGEAIFYGGNDNASGIAMLLTMAEHYAKPENQPRYSMMFVGFGGEEAGLRGSMHYVKEKPAWPLEKTSFVMNMDLMANGIDGITAVAGKTFPQHFERLKALNAAGEYVPKVKSRGNAPNSDHYFFVEKGVNAFFIYTLGGPPHYHDINDTYENMVFSRFYEVRKLLMEFMDGLYR